MPAAADATPHRGVAYRKDIDGLRAIAVLLVVLYHGGLAFIPGGFVGVDVFFVISGYLITRVIMTDVGRGQFSLAEFYRRRIKRLLPAYAVVAIATIAASLLISLPGHLNDTTQGIFSSAFYLSNVWFWWETGYFDGAAELKPFLHTWSLSVEEQFYFVFPLLILGFAALKASARASGIALVAAFAASLITAEWLLSEHASAAFFLLPSRAWELIIGCGLALARLPVPAASARAVSVLAGLTLIVASGLMLEAGPGFPGVSALPACIGSALILWAGGQGDGVGRIVLENPVMVFFGKISYSLYLWHWPLFAFYRYYYFSDPNLPASLAIITLAVLLAALNWWLVELPFRARARLPGRRAFVFAIVVSGSIAAVCGAINLLGGLPQRFPADVQQLLIRESFTSDRADCAGEANTTQPIAKACVYGDSRANPATALWGDSHAQGLVDTLGQEFGKNRESLLFFGHSGCPPVTGVDRIGEGAAIRCADYAVKVEQRLIADPTIATVIVAARHSAYAKGTDGPEEPPNGVASRLVAVPGLPDAPLVDGYNARLTVMVARLTRAGKNVVLVAPVPEIGYDVPRVVALLKLRGASLESLALPWAHYRARHRELLGAMAAMARNPRVAVFDPTRLNCDAQRCVFWKGGVMLYLDDDHLSTAASAMLAPSLYRLARRNPAQSPYPRSLAEANAGD